MCLVSHGRWSDPDDVVLHPIKSDQDLFTGLRVMAWRLRPGEDVIDGGHVFLRVDVHPAVGVAHAAPLIGVTTVSMRFDERADLRLDLRHAVGISEAGLKP